MGLFNKIRSRLGRLGVRASKIGARFVSRFPPRTRGVLGKVAKVAKVGFRFGKIGGRFIPGVGAALTAISVGGLIVGARRRRKAREQVVTAPTVGRAAGAVGAARGISRTARLGLIGAAIGAAAFVGEQIAEKLGVRGGAGFVGRRPKVPGAPRRVRRRRKKKVRRIRRHRHKIVRLKARTVVRSIRRKRSRSRKGKRVSFVTKTGQRVSFTAKR